MGTNVNQWRYPILHPTSCLTQLTKLLLGSHVLITCTFFFWWGSHVFITIIFFSFTFPTFPYLKEFDLTITRNLSCAKNKQQSEQNKRIVVNCDATAPCPCTDISMLQPSTPTHISLPHNPTSPVAYSGQKKSPGYRPSRRRGGCRCRRGSDRHRGGCRICGHWVIQRARDYNADASAS